MRERASSLASVANVTAFSCTVVSTTTSRRSPTLHRSNLDRNGKAILQQRGQALLPHPLSPALQR